MLLANLLLALVWAAFQGEFSLTNLVIGYALGYLVILVLTRGGALEPSPYVGRLHRGVGLAAFFLWELVRANVRLAIDVVTPRYEINPGIIALPLDATDDSEILLLSVLINLTPGSVVLDVSPDRKVLYVHAMHIVTPDAARAEIKQGYERRVLQLLG